MATTHPKSHYTPTLSALSSISLSCGLFAFFTQFLLHSPCTPSLSRHHTLLTLSSYTFLSNILTYLLLTLLLHPVHPHSHLSSRRQRLVRAGIGLLYLFTLVGFIFFAVAIAVAYPGPKVVGIVGVTMFAVTVSGILSFGVSTKGPPPFPSFSIIKVDNGAVEEEQHLLDEKKIKDIGLPKTILTLLIFTVQLTCLGLLLGFGGNALVTGYCNGVVDQVYSTENPMPVEVVGVAAGVEVGGYVTVTKGYSYTATITTTILGTVTEMMTGMESSSSGDGIAAVVDLTSITVLATVTAT